MILCLFAGCEQPQHREVAQQAEYLQRLSNQLGPIPELPQQALPRYPRPRLLRLSVPAQQIDVVQFAQLHRCDLGDLAGERSSGLGRVGDAGLRIAQDQRWLRDGPACVAQGQAWLAGILESKRHWLPSRFWNLVFAGPELAQLLSGTASSQQQVDGLRAPDAGLRDLLDHYQDLQHLTLDLAVLRGTLQQLAQGQRIGVMRRQWQHQRQTLRAAAGLLTSNAARICRNGQPTPKAKVLRRVFDRFYRDAIQPELAQYYGAQRRAVMALKQLVDLLQPVAPAEFMTWYAASLSPVAATGEWQQTQQAVREHAAAWQQLWQHCGMPLLPEPTMALTLAPAAVPAQD